MLIVDVQRRGHPGGQHAGAEASGRAPGHPAVKDQLHLIGPADVEVLANDFLEEDPAAEGSVQDLGQGELGLEDGNLVAVTGGAVLSRKRVRQACQPLASQGVDALGGQAVAQLLQPLRVGAGKDAIIQGLKGDAFLGQLPFDVFVTIEAKLGIVGEVGAELEKERAEVLVDAIEVKVIDHGRRADEPGVFLPGLGIGAFLGTQDRCLLLGLANKEDALGALELGPVLQGDVLFALPLGKRNQRDLILLDEALDCSDEPFTDRVHEGRGGEGVSPVKAQERGNTTLALELGLVDVEVHAVNTFDFQRHMLADDFGNSARYTHGWLRSSWLFEGPSTAKRFYWGCFQYTPFLGTTGAFLHLVGLRRSLVRLSFRSPLTWPRKASSRRRDSSG